MSDPVIDELLREIKGLRRRMEQIEVLKPTPLYFNAIEFGARHNDSADDSAAITAAIAAAAL